MNKILFKMLSSGLSVTMFASCVPLYTSCNNNFIPDVDITSVVLSSIAKYLSPGQSTRIEATINPSGRKFPWMNWKIVESSYEGVSIDERGVVHIPSEIYLTSSSKITICGSVKNKDNIFNTIDLYIVPPSATDFVGFEDNKLEYLDRKHNIRQTEIVATGPFTYEALDTIDLFLFDDEKKPEGFDSLIRFTPIILGSLHDVMSFRRLNKVPTIHGISWLDGYYDDDWTVTIPNFWATNIVVTSEKIEVHFACDSRVCLTINFQIWQAPEQSTQCRASYIPDESDPHYLEYQMLGYYRSPIICPKEKTTGIFKDFMQEILVFKPNGEYTELEFLIYQDDVEPIIVEAITPTIKSSLIRRPFDATRIYSIDLYYTINLKLINGGVTWDYRPIKAFEILAYDPLYYDPFAPTYLARIEFYLDWI